MVGGGEQLPPSVLKAPNITALWLLFNILGVFSALATALFLSCILFRKVVWDTWRLLPCEPTGNRMSQFNCDLMQYSEEISVFLPVPYNSSEPVYTGNYSEKAIVVVQIHTQ